MTNEDMNEDDSGAHYRYEYKGIKLDPYRIAEIYNLRDHALFSVLKKILAAGTRGGKDYKQDIIDSRDALNRKLEMLAEDEEIVEEKKTISNIREYTGNDSITSVSDLPFPS